MTLEILSALRQLVEEREKVERSKMVYGCCACRFDDNDEQTVWCAKHAEMRDELAALREERDREDRLLRNRWSLYSLGGEFVWEHDHLGFATHPDRAEAARMAEEKAK